MTPSNPYLPIAKNGLPPRVGKPKKVIIVGGGMAGLVAAEHLLAAGHEPLILEARGRVGGRIETLREPFTHGLHAEAGAMRIPKAHDLTMFYVRKFGLKLLPFNMGNLNAYYYINRRRMRIAQARTRPGLLGFDLTKHEKSLSPAAHFAALLRPIQEELNRLGPAGWKTILGRYDDYSTWDFLREAKWSDGLINMYGLLENQESRLHSSFIEVLLHALGHSFVKMYQIKGGMDSLPNAFLPTLRNCIRFGAKTTAIAQNIKQVTVEYETDAGAGTITGDFAIITIPFSVLGHVECEPSFSPEKTLAIRRLNYDSSTKIFFQCRRRFWETDDGIRGGGSVTDQPIRNLFYGEQGEATGRGILLASYTWSEDAERWNGLSPQARIKEALQNVRNIHPQVQEEYEVGTSKVWHEDPFALGAFALFGPGDWRRLHEHIIKPEGRIHFAGEHASLSHRWIQGAIESGLRAASEVCAAPLTHGKAKNNKSADVTSRGEQQPAAQASRNACSLNYLHRWDRMAGPPQDQAERRPAARQHLVRRSQPDQGTGADRRRRDAAALPQLRREVGKEKDSP